MIKKIIFDLDDTLLFLSPDWTKGYKYFIDKFKLNITPKELYACIGDFEKNMSDIVVTNKNFYDFLNNKMHINITEEMFNDYLEIYKKIESIDTEMTYSILEYLSKKYELIAYSNWFGNIQRYKLDKYNLLSFFSKVYGWDELPVKPSKSGLEKIINENDVKEYVMIGDIIETDLEMPDKMGMNTIFFNRKKIKQNRFKEIYSIEDLMKIL